MMLFKAASYEMKTLDHQKLDIVNKSRSKSSIGGCGGQVARAHGGVGIQALVPGHIRRVDANLSPRNANSVRQDVRWKFGMPPVNNGNYAWIQHFIHHLSPVGVAGFVIAKTTTSAHSCSMKITEDVCKHAAEQGRRRGAQEGNGRKIPRVHREGRRALRESMNAPNVK